MNPTARNTMVLGVGLNFAAVIACLLTNVAFTPDTFAEQFPWVIVSALLIIVNFYIMKMGDAALAQIKATAEDGAVAVMIGRVGAISGSVLGLFILVVTLLSFFI